MPISPRQRQLVRHLWLEGGLSRWELHERTGLTPNGVGATAAELLDQGLIREASPQPSSGGRPRTPLEIDPVQRHIAALAIRRGQVSTARLNLHGHLVGRLHTQDVARPEQVIDIASRLLQRVTDQRTLCVGVSVTGLIDPQTNSLLFSSAVPGRTAISLEPICQAAGNRPVVLDNDMHALAARWFLTHQAESNQDVLLVSISDGAIGAAMLIEGKPNRGCVVAGNELGHSRFMVETERCFCGHVGCLERICSTAFLRNQPGAGPGNLLQQAAAFNDNNPALETMVRYLATALGNTVNFVRPNRLVLVSELTRCAAFTDHLVRATRANLLVDLVDRVRIDLWDQPAARSAETAGWLALTSLYCDDWGAVKPRIAQGHAAL